MIAVMIAVLLCVTLFGASAFSAEAAGNPVLHYKFDGDFTDSSGGFDGTKVGDITFAEDGVLGKCAVFNNGYLDVVNGSSFNLGKTFTISAWIKIDPNANQGTHHSVILSKLNEKNYSVCQPYALRTISLRMDTRLKNPTDTGTAEVPVVSRGQRLALDTKWTHVVFAGDGTALYLYIDGTLNSTKVLSTGIDREIEASAGKLFVGFDGARNGGDGFFLGRMDDLRVYNYTLSSDEIKALYNNTGVQTAPAAATGTSTPGANVPGTAATGTTGASTPGAALPGTTAPASGTTGTGTPGTTSGPATIINNITNISNNTNTTTNNANTSTNITGSTISNSNIASNNQTSQTTTNDNSIRVTQHVNVMVNGQPLQSDVRPFINADGRTMLPVRAIAEALGATVQWDEATQTATLTLGGKTVRVTIGQNSILVDGQPVPMDTASAIKDGRTLLPVRAVGEALGAQVGWDDQTQTVRLNQ